MSSRRSFIATGAAALAVPAVRREAGAAVAAGTGPYDFPAVAERLARPAKHRQVYATNRVADGVVVGYMKHAMEAYEIAMGEGAGALHPAAVFYGRGVVLGLDSAMWRTFRIAESVKRRGDVLSTPAESGNPFAADFAHLTKRGATLLVCDNALTDWATYLVTTAGFNDRSIEALHADLRGHLLPGALLVPAGVAALNQAQEAHFTYLQASS
ncbi:MAG: hypothetical protein NVSMB19_17380 [Vulcanimicrobiaceae bacterium]